MLQLLVRVSKHLVPPHLQVDLVASVVPLIFLYHPLDCNFPKQALALKSENLRNLDDKILEVLVDDCLVDADEPVDQFLVFKEEFYQLLHPGILVLLKGLLQIVMELWQCRNRSKTGYRHLGLSDLRCHVKLLDILNGLENYRR